MGGLIMNNRDFYRVAREIQYRCKKDIDSVQSFIVYYDNYELQVGSLADEQKMKRKGYAIVGWFDYLPRITNIELRSIVLEVFGI